MIGGAGGKNDDDKNGEKHDPKPNKEEDGAKTGSKPYSVDDYQESNDGNTKIHPAHDSMEVDDGQSGSTKEEREEEEDVGKYTTGDDKVNREEEGAKSHENTKSNIYPSLDSMEVDEDQSVSTKQEEAVASIHYAQPCSVVETSKTSEKLEINQQGDIYFDAQDGTQPVDQSLRDKSKETKTLEKESPQEKLTNTCDDAKEAERRNKVKIDSKLNELRQKQQGDQMIVKLNYYTPE